MPLTPEGAPARVVSFEDIGLTTRTSVRVRIAEASAEIEAGWRATQRARRIAPALPTRLSCRLRRGCCKRKVGKLTLQQPHRRGWEAARAALRSLLVNIPVFQTGRQLAARLTISPGALMRNPGNVLLIGSGGAIR